MGIPPFTGAAWMVDPHLLVLGVLAAGWVLDKVLAFLEWLRGSRPDGRAGGGRRPAGAE